MTSTIFFFRVCMCVCGDSSLVRSFAEPKKKSGEGNNFSKNSFNIFIHFVVVVCLFFFSVFFSNETFFVYSRFVFCLFVCVKKEKSLNTEIWSLRI